MPSSRRAASRKARSFGRSPCSNRSPPPPRPAGRSALVRRPPGTAATTGRRPRAARSRSARRPEDRRRGLGPTTPPAARPTGPTPGRLPGPRLGRVALAAGRLRRPAGRRPASGWSPSTPPATATPTPVPRASPQLVLEFADALAAVVAAHGPAHAVIAHSLGATAAAYAVRAGLAAGRLCSSPPWPTRCPTPDLRRPPRLRRARPHPHGGQGRAPGRHLHVGL